MPAKDPRVAPIPKEAVPPQIPPPNIHVSTCPNPAPHMPDNAINMCEAVEVDGISAAEQLATYRSAAKAYLDSRTNPYRQRKLPPPTLSSMLPNEVHGLFVPGKYEEPRGWMWEGHTKDAAQKLEEILEQESAGRSHGGMQVGGRTVGVSIRNGDV